MTKGLCLYDSKGRKYSEDQIAQLMEELERRAQQDDALDQFYLQDSRSYCGNDVMWWALGGSYTTDLSKAEVFTRDKAQRQHNERPTDIPWPKAYIDARTRPAVDMQYIRKDEALEGSGIVLRKPEKPRSQQYRCEGCQQFMSEAAYYTTDCRNCGMSNRP